MTRNIISQIEKLKVKKYLNPSKLTIEFKWFAFFVIRLLDLIYFRDFFLSKLFFTAWQNRVILTYFEWGFYVSTYSCKRYILYYMLNTCAELTTYGHALKDGENLKLQLCHWYFWKHEHWHLLQHLNFSLKMAYCYIMIHDWSDNILH